MSLTGTHDYGALLRDADLSLCAAAERVASLHAQGRLTSQELDALHDTVARRSATRRDYLLS